MRVWGWACGGVVLLAGLVGGAFAQVVGPQPATGEPARSGAGIAAVTYTFDRPGLAVPRFRLVVREDGTGSFEGDAAAAAEAGAAAVPGASSAMTHVEREVSLTPATTAKIFKAARAAKFFRVTCASKAKNIADTGAKSLSYEGPDGKGTCAYNYSENKDVVMLTDLFLGISTTLDEGRRLEFKRRYDRLGLDAELDVLTQANDAGRAVELSTIAPVLRQLAGDTETMERVRLRAAKLLDRAADGR